jgi:hypothetical protein
MTTPTAGLHLGWLTNSLEHHATMMRNQARRCRGAYKTEPMRTMALELADAYDAAAEVFAAALKRAREKTPPL